MKRILLVSLLVLALPGYAASTRLLVVISDLHWGVGHTDQCAWRHTEDFRWRDNFRLFLQNIEGRGNNNVDLVIAGDLLELWQPLTPSCRYNDANLSCTSADAIARVATVLEQHKKDFLLLADFASHGTNTVTVVPGNHDAALMFPDVAGMVLRALQQKQGRATVAASGYWLSPDKLIFIEHGQQIGADLNRFDTWPKPFAKNHPEYLQRTWGEQFVDKFYNPYEERYPIIDNVLDNQGIRYGIKAEGLAGMTKAAGGFLRLYFRELSWPQISGSLGEEKPPEWDIAAERSRGDQFLIESIPEDDPLRDLAVAAAAKGELDGPTMADLSDDDIQAICDYRAAQSLEGVPVHRCPVKTLGALVSAVTRSRDKVFAARLSDIAAELEKAGDTTPFEVYIFGHTHTAKQAFNPHRQLRPDWPVSVINTGAWQRLASVDQMRKLECGRTAAAVLKDTPLSALPACYTAVIVDPYATNPVPLLRYWSGSGELSTECVWVPPSCQTIKGLREQNDGC